MMRDWFIKRYRITESGLGTFHVEERVPPWPFWSPASSNQFHSVKAAEDWIVWKDKYDQPKKIVKEFL